MLQGLQRIVNVAAFGMLVSAMMNGAGHATAEHVIACVLMRVAQLQWMFKFLHMTAVASWRMLSQRLATLVAV
jgi:hypothetical protein